MKITQKFEKYIPDDQIAKTDFKDLGAEIIEITVDIPEITGTEKQIAYATKIRDKSINSLVKSYGKIKNRIERNLGSESLNEKLSVLEYLIFNSNCKVWFYFDQICNSDWGKIWERAAVYKTDTADFYKRFDALKENHIENY